MIHTRLVPACLLAVVVLSEAQTASGPFGILQLPAEYESHRASFRQSIGEAETTVAEMEGEGCLRHFWLTIAGIRNDGQQGLRLTLRIYFDGASQPSVEMPVTPFFGIHHGHLAGRINSSMLQVTDRSGFNSYFPMPYKDGMRMTLQSEGPEPIGVWFQADYQRYAPGALSDGLRFRALYRHVERAEAYGAPYHLGHGAGRGFIAGLTLGVREFDRRDRWYHCGGDLVLLDGNRDRAHLLSGIGGEDFFGTAWGQEVFANGPIGTPYYDESPDAPADQPRVVFAAYRIFDRDPIRFADSFSYDFGSLANDMSSVLYWYQDGDSPVAEGLTWSLCGPFTCENRREFDKAEFPERQIDYSQTAEADFGQYSEAVKRGRSEATQVRWVRDIPSVFRFTDVTPHFRPRLPTNGGFPVNVSAYATTTIHAETAGIETLRVGHDDWLKLWVNGHVVYAGDELNGFQTREIQAPLVQGENRLLVKTANRDNTNFRAWVFLLDQL